MPLPLIMTEQLPFSLGHLHTFRSIILLWAAYLESSGQSHRPPIMYMLLCFPELSILASPSLAEERHVKTEVPP